MLFHSQCIHKVFRLCECAHGSSNWPAERNLKRNMREMTHIGHFTVDLSKPTFLAIVADVLLFGRMVSDVIEKCGLFVE